MKEIEHQISKLLENNLIEESYSPFAAPVTLAFKKEDGRRSRLCIDFRKLNKIVVPPIATISANRGSNGKQGSVIFL